MDQPSPDNTPVPTDPITAFLVEGKPCDFELPPDFKTPVFTEAQLVDDRGAIYMDPKYPLEVRFEMLRAFVKKLKVENTVLRRDVSSITPLVLSEDLEAATEALEQDGEAYTGEALLDAEARHQYEFNPLRTTDWSEVGEATRNHWRERALKTYKFCYLRMDGETRRAFRSSGVTGLAAKAAFGIPRDHGLLLMTPSHVGQLVQDTDVIHSSAQLIDLVSQPPSNGG